MSPMTNSQTTQRKSGRFSFLMEEWVFQLALVVTVVSDAVSTFQNLPTRASR